MCWPSFGAGVIATSGALDAFGGATSNTVSAAAPLPPATFDHVVLDSVVIGL